ncbi:rRNA methyltransferase [Marinobacterium aestuarii]|uniref:Ribosomal RNA large subunit methyltransferase J n=1 Tax=Marinobacterium aestuarii TaxID=1821621 RepID=A0A1A9F193_9GAMM|nr:23S rRNA (adenine(2030)-N(6))-methyltransferase RlmJ [Marinobacterium aestuarii]ANG63529.1 rRNA methyltransferase [Marinobacterium aestuarii]
MLSYRHAYHAGNYADVLKHLVLARTLEYMTSKDTPLLYLDTHAGAGSYHLGAAMAKKTAEFKEGIGRLWGQPLPDALTPLMAVLRQINPKGDLEHYPGSPQVAAKLLRKQDALRLFELHPSDYRLLSERFATDRRVRVERSDGFVSLKALLPPPSKRALVLIDPPYENKGDYRQVLKVVLEGYKRFPIGTYLIWYPVVVRARIDDMVRGFKSAGVRNLWQAELGLGPDTEDFGMTSSGLFMINPPWTLPGELKDALPLLQSLIAPEQGRWELKQLVGE